jgi:hypothetical protein
MAQHDINALVLAFNIRPLQYTHPSRLPGDRRPALQRILDVGHRQSVDLACRWWLDAQDLRHRFDWNFSNRQKRLLLLDGGVLLDMVTSLGLFAFWQEFRRWVLRSEVERLSAVFGTAHVDFLFSHSATAKPVARLRMRRQFAADDLGRTVRHVGARLLSSLFSAADGPSVRRAALKLPVGTELAANADLPMRQRTPAASFCIDTFIPHWAPLWRWLF